MAKAKAAKKVCEDNGRTWEDGCERPFRFDPNSSGAEGRFRLYPPKGLENYHRANDDTPGISEIVGISGGRIIVQALSFNRDVFTEEIARAWWEKNKGKYKFYEGK